MKNKNTTTNIGGTIVRENNIYTVTDNTDLNDLILSSTMLHAGFSTTGHKHKGQEEIYIFMSGNGIMQLDDTTFDVKQGDIVTIEDGVFHKVFNDNKIDLYFICVFAGKRSQ